MSDWLNKQLARPTGDALVASVRELLTLQVHPDHIARRMGRPTVSALTRYLRRIGEPGLANDLTRDPMADQTYMPAPISQREVWRGNRTLGK